MEIILLTRRLDKAHVLFELIRDEDGKLVYADPSIKRCRNYLKQRAGRPYPLSRVIERYENPNEAGSDKTTA